MPKINNVRVSSKLEKIIGVLCIWGTWIVRRRLRKKLVPYLQDTINTGVTDKANDNKINHVVEKFIKEFL